MLCLHAAWAQDPSSCSSGLYSYLSSHCCLAALEASVSPVVVQDLEHVTVLFIRRERSKEGLP